MYLTIAFIYLNDDAETQAVRSSMKQLLFLRNYHGNGGGYPPVGAVVDLHLSNTQILPILSRKPQPFGGGGLFSMPHSRLCIGCSPTDGPAVAM